MKAEPGKTYAQIIDNKVRWIFTSAELPEWRDDAFVVHDITDLDPQPQAGWSLVGDTLQAPPAPTLTELKAARRAEFNKRRESATAAGVAYGGKTIDTDPVSIQKINGAVTMAVIAALSSQPFSITWTCADDSSLILDGPGIMAMGVAVGTYVDSLHRRTRVAKDALDAAATPAEVAAIVW